MRIITFLQGFAFFKSVSGPHVLCFRRKVLKDPVSQLLQNSFLVTLEFCLLKVF